MQPSLQADQISRYMLVLALLLAILPHSASAQATSLQPWFLDAIGTPENLKAPSGSRPIVIAIVDDGVRSSHDDLRGFIWSNPAEIAHNRVDDDGNNYADDVHGWDVSDGDNSAEPPANQPQFYHGTHLAGVVARIARQAYGDAATKFIKIIPIKVLQDSSQSTYLKQAYEGIDYALAANADIILSAWGMVTITEQESRILERAEEQGALIVASAGNFPDERNQFPAAYPGVLAVSSIDRRGRKSASANFGPFVDIAAPGEGIEAASVESDTAYQARDGSSGAAAMVAAAAALLKVQHPGYSTREIKACLLSGSKALDPAKPEEQAKMGSGALDIAAALDCKLLEFGSHGDNQLDRPKGYLRPASPGATPVTWAIEPEGNIKGFRFSTIFNRGDSPGDKLEFRQSPSSTAETIASFTIPELPQNLYVAGDKAYVTYVPDGHSVPDFLLAYEADTIDTRTLHCRGTTRLNEEGSITDGSGALEYSYNTDCKWLITAPPGKVVRFQFLTLDTETQRDMIYFFNGAGTHEDIMAIFSGNKLPPELTTWNNQVLVWFVTDGQNQGQGWQATYRFVDPVEP
jgi:hypothetical protein